MKGRREGGGRKEAKEKTEEKNREERGRKKQKWREKKKKKQRKKEGGGLMGVQFSSVQSLDRLGRRGDMRDDSAEILFQAFLQKTLVSSSGMGRDVHSLMLSIQHFLCRPRHRCSWGLVGTKKEREGRRG